LAKIAVDLERALSRREVDGTPGRAMAHLLAAGSGWTVEDVICTSGPHDRKFEERHSNVCIAIVVAGSFQYRAEHGSPATGELMTPGSLLLGGAGEYFECGHDHGAGDRCLSFHYAADYFEALAADAGVRDPRRAFQRARLPPTPRLSRLIARACERATGSVDVPWEHLSIQLAAQTLQLVGDPCSRPGCAPPHAVARVTEIVRMIERRPDLELTLARLAGEAGLSPYHFLRTFERVTGVTPHQYILRARLREAAARLISETPAIIDVAYDCGFGDVSNFNRAFRAEFGVSPRLYRTMAPGRGRHDATPREIPETGTTSAAAGRADGSACR
jgi:AraC family transcriptional regulator